MSIGNDELTLNYWPADGLVGRILYGVFVGLPSVGIFWLSFLCINQMRIMAGIAPSTFDNLQLVADPGGAWQVFACAAVLLPLSLGLGVLNLYIAVISRRIHRRCWWLRLTADGFQVNDRACRLRAYRWVDIDEFLLVYPPGTRPPSVAPDSQSVGDVLRDGTEGPPVRVGFRYLPDRRRHPRRQADGYVMGYWDRPFDLAVLLMNEWLDRHRSLPKGDL